MASPKFGVDPSIPITTRIELQTHSKLLAAARHKNTSQTALIRTAINQYLECQTSKTDCNKSCVGRGFKLFLLIKHVLNLGKRGTVLEFILIN